MGSISAGANLLTINASAVTQIFANLSGTLGLIKNGNGTLSLVAGNSLSGPILVNAGTLAPNLSSSLINASNITIAGGATLNLNNNVNLSAPLFVSGARRQWQRRNCGPIRLRHLRRPH